MRATWVGLKSASEYIVSNYLISGILYHFYQGRQSYLIENIENREEIVSILDDFQVIAVEELEIADGGFSMGKEELADDLISKIEPVKHEVYPAAAPYLFNDASSTSDGLPVPVKDTPSTDITKKREKTFLCMVLAREQIRFREEKGSLRNETLSDIRQSLRSELAEFNFTSPGEHESRFLSTFESLRSAIHGGSREECGALYSGAPEEPERVYQSFVYNFLPFLDFPEYDIEGKSEKERLRSKVIRVVRQGELNTAAAGRNILEIIRAEEERIRREYHSQNAFIVFSQHWYGNKETDLFKQRLQRKFPTHIETSGGRYFYSTPKIEGQEPFYLTKHIVFTETEYSGGEDFFGRALEDIIPDGQFVAVLETSNTSPFYPQSEETLLEKANTPGNLQNAINQVGFFETTSPQEDITSKALDNLIGDEIDVKEMLRSLRMDVLMPQISQDEIKVLRENRTRIEDNFEIEDIFDWRKKNPRDVGRYIFYHDSETNNTEEDWQENAETLIETSEQWYMATESTN